MDSKPIVRSVGPYGRNTIMRTDDDGNEFPYMTRYWLGRLRLHVFHSPDLDQDPHSHPWNFWTFPFRSYVEEVTEPEYGADGQITYTVRKQIVPAWRFNFRPASHTHKVLGVYSGYAHDGFQPERMSAAAAIRNGFSPLYHTAPLVTIVWRSGFTGRWGFLKNREGKWCWVDFADYIRGTGRHTPCE